MTKPWEEWYRPEDAERDVGMGLTVEQYARILHDKRKDIKLVPLESKLLKTLNKTWATVTWEEMLPACQEDIFELCYWMRFNPTPQQRKVLEAAQDGHRRIACKSGQGPGKTCVSAIIGLWWELQDVDVRTIVTAPSMKQCKDVWLSEVRTRMGPAHPLLKKFIFVSATRVFFGGRKHNHPIFPEWRCELITATGDTSFQGQHNKRLNAIVEEASGVATDIIEALKGTVSNVKSEWQDDAEEGTILMIGNPNTRDGEFFKCFGKMRGDWHCITLNAEESPIVNPKKIIEHAREFGIDSDFFRVRVLGEFPATDPTSIMNPDDVYASVDTPVDIAAAHLYPQRQYGIDLARQGGDETVVYRRLGACVVEWRKWSKTHGFEPAHAIRWAFKQQVEAEWFNHQCLYVFDAGGIGQGVMHLFEEAGKDFLPFHSQNRPSKPMIYKDRMTEAWFQASRILKTRKARIPDDPILHEQLCQRRYQITKDGLLQVEPKKDYMKRTGLASPDRADAFVMAFYQSTYTSSKVAKKNPNTRARTR